MALNISWDDIFGNGTQTGAEDASKYMQPYFEGGSADYQKWRDFISNLGGQLGKYGNPADWMWSQAGQNPADFYQTLMKGYTETPQAKYEQQQMEDTTNRAASASGLLGSGSYLQGLQENSGDIIARDQDRYLNNILDVNRQQQSYLNDFRNQENIYRSGLAGSAEMGYNAARDLGDLAYQRDQGTNDIWSGIGNFVGGLAGDASYFF